MKEKLRRICIEVLTDSTEDLAFLKKDLQAEISCCSAFYYVDDMVVTEKRVYKEKIRKIVYPNSLGKYADMEKLMYELGEYPGRKRQCIVCENPFAEDDDVYLALMRAGGNKFACKRCAEEFQRKKEDESHGV